VSNAQVQKRKGAKVIIVASVCVATLASSRLAHAQGKSADALFEEGLKLFDAGKTHEACERFEASFRIDPALGTLQNLATCHEQDGKTATAYREFLDLAEQAKKAGAGQKAREILGRQRAEALTSKLSKILIQAKPGANVVEVRLDGTLVDLAAWGVAFPVDPGRHALVFSAPGRVASTQEINLAAAPGVTTVDLPHLEDVPPPPPTPVASPSPLRPIGIAVGSAGLVGLVLSGVFGGLTFAKRDAAAPHCSGMYCDPEGLGLQSSAHGFATASTTTFVLGLAATGTGVFLFVWGSRASRTTASVSPALGGARAMLRF
jgi:hypothetical protein